MGERSLDLLFTELVHLAGRLADQKAQHFGLGRELDQWELDRLVLGQRPAEGFALARVFDTFVDTIDRSAQRTRRLANPVLMDEALCERQSTSNLAELRILRYEHVGKADARMIGWHVEGPQILLDLDAGAVRRHQKTGDAARIAVVA